MPVYSTDPRFNGVLIFGPAPTVRARWRPLARQWNSYAGVNGRQTTSHGSRGATGEASGILFGEHRVDLQAAENALEFYKLDGGAYLLIDSDQVPWDNMILIDYVPGRLFQDANGWWREYTATFESTRRNNLG